MNNVHGTSKEALIKCALVPVFSARRWAYKKRLAYELAKKRSTNELNNIGEMYNKPDGA